MANNERHLWNGRSIIHPQHEADLEQQAAINEFQHGLSRDLAEAQAYREYRKTQHEKAAAYHLRGLKSAQGSGDLDAAKTHGVMYSAHMEKLGHQPWREVPPEIKVHLDAPEKEKVHKFKATGADQFVLDDHKVQPNEPIAKSLRKLHAKAKAALEKLQKAWPKDEQENRDNSSAHTVFEDSMMDHGAVKATAKVPPQMDRLSYPRVPEFMQTPYANKGHVSGKLPPGRPPPGGYEDDEDAPPLPRLIHDEPAEPKAKTVGWRTPHGVENEAERMLNLASKRMNQIDPALGGRHGPEEPYEGGDEEGSHAWKRPTKEDFSADKEFWQSLGRAVGHSGLNKALPEKDPYVFPKDRKRGEEANTYGTARPQVVQEHPEAHAIVDAVAEPESKPWASNSPQYGFQGNVGTSRGIPPEVLASREADRKTRPPRVPPPIRPEQTEEARASLRVQRQADIDAGRHILKKPVAQDPFGALGKASTVSLRQGQALTKAWPKDEAENQQNIQNHLVLQDHLQEKGKPFKGGTRALRAKGNKILGDEARPYQSEPADHRYRGPHRTNFAEKPDRYDNDSIANATVNDHEFWHSLGRAVGINPNQKCSECGVVNSSVVRQINPNTRIEHGVNEAADLCPQCYDLLEDMSLGAGDEYEEPESYECRTCSEGYQEGFGASDGECSTCAEKTAKKRLEEEARPSLYDMAENPGLYDAGEDSEPHSK